MNQSRRGKRRPSRKQAETASLDLSNHLECGRSLAWFAVQQFDENGTFIRDVINDADVPGRFTRAQRGQAVDMASGVIRRRRTIDTVLESQVTRPRGNVEPDLWRLLQLGTWQVLYSKTPEHAAVDSIVTLAKRTGCGRWSGFANGILRNVQRLLQTEQSADPRYLLPTDGGGITLSAAVLPDPREDRVDYMGRAYSLPRSLARRWCGRYSDEELIPLCLQTLAPPALTGIRVNLRRTTVSEVQTRLESAGACVISGPVSESLLLDVSGSVDLLPGFQEGLWVVQDPSACQVGLMLDPQPGEVILDLCAAPGGKATHLAELMGDEGTVIACDVTDWRLKRVQENVERLQLSSVKPCLIERDGNGVPELPYDAVLLDVPCSNSGVLARRPEARWRFSENDLRELTELQMELLLRSVDHVRPGGRIVYSTCSIEPEETTDLVAAAVDHVFGLTLKNQCLQLPNEHSDGAFRALLEWNE
ncbi:MAG TPA: 16S rRNA (cytosine(967)-C(5))-methyltransferase [Planctomycetaceae bacterium]|nr:16S rRNA (cytosine(967)-C(5))-methyltransferase [Planctomycetaceae bacterium]